MNIYIYCDLRPESAQSQQTKFPVSHRSNKKWHGENFKPTIKYNKLLESIQNYTRLYCIHNYISPHAVYVAVHHMKYYVSKNIIAQPNCYQREVNGQEQYNSSKVKGNVSLVKTLWLQSQRLIHGIYTHDTPLVVVRTLRVLSTRTPEGLIQFMGLSCSESTGGV